LYAWLNRKKRRTQEQVRHKPKSSQDSYRFVPSGTIPCYIDDVLMMVCSAMAGALPQQPGYMPAQSASSGGGQYVGGPGQPQVPAPGMGHPGTAGPHPQVTSAPGAQMQHQPGPNEASLAALISFD